MNAEFPFPTAPDRSREEMAHGLAARPRLTADAVLFKGRKTVELESLSLIAPQAEEVIVDIDYSGVSAGTERLFWTGDMPSFPGLSYPLVPGYEAVGRIAWSADEEDVGRQVFVPGARCFDGAAGLFGASASRVVARRDRLVDVDCLFPEEATLFALAATARHAIAGGAPPDLIVGHGVLGRLLARLTLALGAPAPTVWEIDPARTAAQGYPVIAPGDDKCTEYKSIYDVSGATNVIDDLVSRLARGGEIVLAGFYRDRVSFAHAAAFMKEARFRLAAEWAREDLEAVAQLVADDILDLSGLVTHRAAATDAAAAYETAFEDPSCLKMILDWSGRHD